MEAGSRKSDHYTRLNPAFDPHLYEGLDKTDTGSDTYNRLNPHRRDDHHYQGIVQPSQRRANHMPNEYLTQPQPGTQVVNNGARPRRQNNLHSNAGGLYYSQADEINRHRKPNNFHNNSESPYYSQPDDKNYDHATSIKQASPRDYYNVNGNPTDVYYSQPPDEYGDEKYEKLQKGKRAGNYEVAEDSVKNDNERNERLSSGHKGKDGNAYNKNPNSGKKQNAVYDNKDKLPDSIYNTIKSIPDINGDLYDYIQADQVQGKERSGSQASMHSTVSSSSVAPILKDDKKHSGSFWNRKKKWLVIIIIAVILAIVIVGGIVGGLMTNNTSSDDTQTTTQKQYLPTNKPTATPVTGTPTKPTSTITPSISNTSPGVSVVGSPTNISTVKHNNGQNGDKTSPASGINDSTLKTSASTPKTTSSTPHISTSKTTASTSKITASTSTPFTGTLTNTTSTSSSTVSTAKTTASTSHISESTSTPITGTPTKTASTLSTTASTSSTTTSTLSTTVSTSSTTASTSSTTASTSSTTASTSLTTETTSSIGASTPSTPLPSPNSTLVVIDHPISKARLVGDSATLCCDTAGNPPPQFYDWFKDGQLLPAHTQVTSGSSSIKLTNLKLSDTGKYTCRAKNDYGYIMSDEALLDVKATDSFCSSTPQEYKVSLPTGCTAASLSTTVNMGQCPPKPCRGSNQDPNNCKDSNSYCCGPVSLTPVSVTCGSETLNVFTVSQCGCVHCGDPYYNILGVGQSIDGTSRYANGHIYVKNISSTYNDRFSDLGVFKLKIKQNSRRLVLVTYNVYNRPFYNMSHHVLHLPPAYTSPTYSTADLRFVKRKTTAHPSNETISINVLFPNGGVFLQLDIPGNKYKTSNGDAYNGAIQLSTNAIPSSDMSALRAAPGDFTFVSGDGQQQFLFVQGIFAVQFDQNTEHLNYDGSIVITLPSSTIVNPSSAQLWRLGDSGYWHLEDTLSAPGKRKKRKITTLSVHGAAINNIDNGHAWFAIAHPANVDKCVTKVRVFDNDLTLSGNQLKGAHVIMYVRNSVSGAGIFTARVYSDHGDMNGYCIMHPCGTGITGIVSGTYEDIPLNAMNPNTGNKVSLVLNTPTSSSTGPTYRATEAGKCSNAPMTNAYVSFKRPGCERIYDAVQPPRSFTGLSCTVEYYKTWHTPQEYSMQNFKSCHIKVYNPGGAGNLFRAISYVGRLSHQVGNSQISPGQLYGFREDCISNTNGADVACLQIKVGGSRNCNDDFNNQKTDNKTKVSIFAVNKTLSVSEVDSAIRSYVQNQTTIFTLLLHESTFGSYAGIYCTSDNTLESARWRSKRLCMSGTTNEIDVAQNDVQNRKWAVTFR